MHEFLRVHAPLILRLARRAAASGRDVDPQDVAQEVVLALLRSNRAGSFEPARVENAEAYLRVVVGNAARRARAQRARGDRVGDSADLGELVERQDRTPPDGAPTADVATEQALDARRRIDALKARLRPRDAVAFAMLVEDGMSIDEVAAALGTPANNVYQMRHRILVAAREIEGGAGAVRETGDAGSLEKERRPT